jgi:DNA-binding response OmpR family regulator
MSKEKFNILLAEDDPNLGKLLVDYLEGEGLKVRLCKDGEEALKAFGLYPFQLCLLDVMMPKMDGFTLGKMIRTKDPKIPIIYITARSLKQDKLEGYNIGADDYITKPFDEEELLWKIKSVIRRISVDEKEHEKETVFIGKYTFDPNNQSLSLNGSVRRITEKENSILQYLSDNRNKLIKREDMLKELWGENDYFLGRSLDVFITKIKKYLGEDPAIRFENVFGVGFIFHIEE